MLLIAVTRRYWRRRIKYSYGHPASFNPAVITNEEAQMIYVNMNNGTGSSQAAEQGSTLIGTKIHKNTHKDMWPHVHLSRKMQSIVGLR